jgi:hypothetical protein
MGPLIAFPPCSEPRTAALDAEVQGLDLPEGAVVTGVERADPLVTVTGYVGLTPVRIRKY